MSPILVRPVREQLEHDRVIRLLQVKYKRKFDVAMNPGQSQVAPVGNGPNPWYPDLVLQAVEKGRKLKGVVEVETEESVNHLEAMSQWATFSKLRVPFHLYVPATSIDTARRLCTNLRIPADEIWAYHTVGDQFRFALIQRSEAAEAAARAAARVAAAEAADGAGGVPAARPKRSALAPRPTAAKAKPKAKAAAIKKKPATRVRVAPVSKAGSRKTKAPRPVSSTVAKRKPLVRPVPRKAVKRAASASKPQKRKRK